MSAWQEGCSALSSGGVAMAACRPGTGTAAPGIAEAASCRRLSCLIARAASSDATRMFVCTSRPSSQPLRNFGGPPGVTNAAGLEYIHRRENLECSTLTVPISSTGGYCTVWFDCRTDYTRILEVRVRITELVPNKQTANSKCFLRMRKQRNI